MRVLSLFSGIGLLDLGLAWAGMQTVGLCEIEPYCRWVLEQHWPGVPIWSDVREVTGDAVRERCGSVDLVAGGFPCQPHSVAGKRKGKDDERHLWPEFARVVREVRPRWVLAENVPNLKNTAADEVLADLDAAGYSCWPCVVGADDVGAPHRRKRVWIVARLRLAHGDGERERDAHEQGRQQRAGWSREADAGGCGEAVAHRDGGGQHRQRLEGGDAEGQRGCEGASGDEPDGCGARPVGDTAGSGLRAGGERGAACPHAPDPTLLRGWPARPGGRQREWEAARLVNAEGRGAEGLGNADEIDHGRAIRAGELREPSQGSGARRQRVAASSGQPGQSEPGVGGAVDGSARWLARCRSAARRARLKALGNGVVPQIVSEVGRAILAAEAGLA